MIRQEEESAAADPANFAIKYNKLQKFKTAKKQTRFVASGRMMLRTHILKGDNNTMSNNILQFNEEIIKDQIKDLVRGSVEETLNGLLEAEADPGG